MGMGKVGTKYVTSVKLRENGFLGTPYIPTPVVVKTRKPNSNFGDLSDTRVPLSKRMHCIALVRTQCTQVSASVKYCTFYCNCKKEKAAVSWNHKVLPSPAAALQHKSKEWKISTKKVLLLSKLFKNTIQILSNVFISDISTLPMATRTIWHHYQSHTKFKLSTRCNKPLKCSG